MGSVINAFTEKIDIMPTVLDLLDLDIPLQCDAHSLKTFLCGKNPLVISHRLHAKRITCFLIPSGLSLLIEK